MIEVKIMTEQAYKTLQKNYREIAKMINDHPSDGSWLKNYLGFEPYETKKYFVKDFVLENSDDYSAVSLKNAITLYEALNELPRYILCDIKFWAWITFEKAYKQAIATINPVKESVVDQWWLPNNSRRDLMLQVIARGYFIAETTVDKTNENKYCFTEYVLNTLEIYRNLVFRNIGMLPNVAHAFVKVCRDVSIETGVYLNNDKVREIMKETSKIGSVMLIDTMDTEEIYANLYPKVIKANA